MEEGDLILVLSGLSSLMEDENDESEERLDEGFILHHDINPHFAHASFSDYLFDSSRSGPLHVNLREYDNQITTRSFALIIQLIRSWIHVRIYPITRDLHYETWIYFKLFLPGRFIRSPIVVKEAIMADINDLVQDFWRTLSDGADGESYFAMRRLLEILQDCYFLERNDSKSRDYFIDHERNKFGAKFKILLDEYRKMYDRSILLVRAEDSNF